MKKIIFIITLCFFTMVNVIWANQTRMATLMVDDYIDDLVNIGIYPHQIVMYANNLYGDIRSGIEDYGIIITPDVKYGALACWQNDLEGEGFNIGYGINLFKFDIGLFGSPVKDHLQYALGIGRSYFNRRFDLSIIVSPETENEWYKFNLRFSERRGDFIIEPKYSFDHVREPIKSGRHKIGLMLQRLILNEGFVYFIAEYDFSRGDIENDETNVYAGLELPLGKNFVLLFGVKENFSNGFETPEWVIEPGFSIRIREFNFDFHLNKERFFERNVPFFNSFGLDLNFGRF